MGKPESHSDVINKQPSCLLLGYGWVGQHVHKYFTEAEYYTPNLGLRDKQGRQLNLPWNSPHTEQILKDKKVIWDVAFISTPSPMNPDGSCDTSFVENAVETWHKYVGLFICRSTVTPGTCEALAKKYNTMVVMQPEYIGETLGHPMLEPDRHNPVVILGGSTKLATNLAAKYWALVLHADAVIHKVDALTAEFCKYMENCYLATKVMFVNDWARLCEAAGVDYMDLREVWLADPRIGRSHTLVYENNPGFSGKCLPKDLNSIAHYARNLGQPLELVEFLLQMNAKMREGIPTTVPLLPEKEQE